MSAGDCKPAWNVASDGGKRPETAAQISEAVQQQVARPKSAQAAVPSQDSGEWEEMKSSAGAHPSSYIRTLNATVRWRREVVLGRKKDPGIYDRKKERPGLNVIWPQFEGSMLFDKLHWLHKTG